MFNQGPDPGVKKTLCSGSSTLPVTTEVYFVCKAACQEQEHHGRQAAFLVFSSILCVLWRSQRSQGLQRLDTF